MNKPKLPILIFQVLAVFSLVCGTASAQATARLSSSFLARGERAVLEVSVDRGQVDEMPEIPTVENIEIQPNGGGRTFRGRPGRNLSFTYDYIVAGYDVGKHVIPPIEVMVEGVPTFTEPVEFEIFNPDELKYTEIPYAGRTLRYASAFRVADLNPYVNQAIQAEIKLYVPEDLFVDDWGIPDVSREGLKAWRFQPNFRRSVVNLHGVPHVAVAYPTTFTPDRTGTISLGPARIRLITREVIQNPLPQQVNLEVYVQVPILEFEARALPPNAPKGFANAVGDFRISSTTSQTEVTEGDPISLDLVVSGSGNLDILESPSLANENGWKVYGASRQQRDDERREFSGTVVFHQSIRPLELKQEIPSYRLVYFDPKSESYKTAVTAPIPLTMTPSTAAPTPMASAAMQALPVPFEKMNDILGLMPTAQLSVPAASSIPGWVGHLLAGLISLGLILKAVWMRWAPKLKQSPDRIAREKELKEVERAKANGDSEFLRAAGHAVEKWIGSNPSPELQSILAERDAVCFRSEKGASSLDPKRRDEILRTLRKALLTLSLALFVGAGITGRAEAAPSAQAASEAMTAYEAANYEEAIQLWLGSGDLDTLSADVLYNIGNACYRSGSPGQAALYYRRALAQDSTHEEARQNLRFIERRFGSIAIQRADYQYALARFPLGTWKGLFWAGVWMCLIAILIFPATRQDARIRIAAATALVLSPMVLAAGAVGWRYFPNDAEFAPVSRQAVVIHENATVHTDAARTAPEVIDAPPGSICQIIRESGRWAYVAFATKTRGWIPLENIEQVKPEKPVSVPKFRKPEASESNA